MDVEENTKRLLSPENIKTENPLNGLFVTDGIIQESASKLQNEGYSPSPASFIQQNIKLENVDNFISLGLVDTCAEELHDGEDAAGNFNIPSSSSLQNSRCNAHIQVSTPFTSNPLRKLKIKSKLRNSSIINIKSEINKEEMNEATINGSNYDITLKQESEEHCNIDEVDKLNASNSASGPSENGEISSLVPKKTRRSFKRKIYPSTINSDGESVFHCDACDYQSMKLSKLKKHAVKHRDPTYFCNVCDYKTFKKYNLTQHMYKHSIDKPFECNICDYKANRKAHLDTHLLTHCEEKPFNCNLCDYKCVRKVNLKYHMLNHNNEKPYGCHICDVRFIKKYDLQQHILIHSGDRPYQCHLCDYKGIKKYNYQQHLLTHSEKQQLFCNLCDYKCFWDKSMKQHMAMHLDKNVLRCEQCTYKTVRRTNLKRHMVTHSFDRPINCNLCNYKTARQGDLRRHMITHSSERPFKCETCSYSCARKNDLKKHIVLLHSFK